MENDAVNIHDFLPLRRSDAENDYINYLWNSYERLATSEDQVSAAFSITAFHLLFMLAVQYKALRVYENMPNEYRLCFTLDNIRKDQRHILAPRSVFDLSLLPERTIFQLFELVDITPECVSGCKKIIDRRNNEFMHASGNLVTDVDVYVQNCLKQLGRIQQCFVEFNNRIASDWSHELDEYDDIPEFVGIRLYDTRLTQADFASGTLDNLFGFVVQNE